MKIHFHTLTRLATAIAVAFLVYSCGGKKNSDGEKKLSDLPVQVISNMSVIQKENGVLKMRMEASRMERYDKDTISYETFPSGLIVYSYNEEGKLETIISADDAIHNMVRREKSDIWSAYGNVVLENIINHQVMETDTLFWDKNNDIIWTDCYVEMYSPDGYMQGFGMVSDQKGRSSIIKKPFNSYGYTSKDTTKIILDTANFIGPMLNN